MNKILIHTCCADCASKMLEVLEREFTYQSHQMVLYYYNPNIHPESEWLARMNAVKLIAEKNNVELIIENWQPKHYFNRIKKIQAFNLDVSMQTIRCPQCYELQLSAAADYAAKNNFSSYTSTMLTSEYLLTDAVKIIGWQQGTIHKVNFVIPETIKCDLKTRGFYKQNYCGCVFSLKSRMEEKYLQ